MHLVRFFKWRKLQIEVEKAHPLSPTVPLPWGPQILWSHNDYLHLQPLTRALANNCMFVEVDGYVPRDANGQFLVAHDYTTVQEGNTLDSLYLAPLRNAPPTRPLLLVIDPKNLAPCGGEKLVERAAAHLGAARVPAWVNIMLTHNSAASRARSALVADGRVDNWCSSLDAPAALVPVISGDFNSFFAWGDDERGLLTTIRAMALQARSRGKYLRFWAMGSGAATREEWVRRARTLRTCGDNVLIGYDTGWQLDALLRLE